MRQWDKLSEKFLRGGLKDRSLAEVSEYAVSETDLPTVQRFIRDLFIPFSAANFHKIIPIFPWRSILTTNLDLVVESAYEEVKDRVQTPITILKNSQKFDQELREVPNAVEFVKLHGSCDHYLDLEIPFVLATEQYVKFSQNRSRLFARLTDLASEYNIIFCGYSVLDPHIQSILHAMFDLGSVRPPYFIVKPEFDEVEDRYWSATRVTPIKEPFAGFLISLKEQLDPTLATATTRAMGSGDPIRRFYIRTNVSETPDLASSLSRDFTLVHSGMSISNQTAVDFYKGYDTGFFPIVHNMDVRRDVTDTILASIFLRTDE